MSLKMTLALVATAFAALNPSFADVVELKDKAAITGKVLAEKRESVVIDVGYTVLVIPRSAVTKVLTGESATSAAKPTESKPTASVKNATPEVKSPSDVSQGLYQTASKSGPERNIRDLVNQLGEAVVQVRAPSGLGSGFFLNE